MFELSNCSEIDYFAVTRAFHGIFHKRRTRVIVRAGRERVHSRAFASVFVAQGRREWRWARRPNYELFSPRHGAPWRCLYAPTWRLLPSTARNTEAGRDARIEDVSAGFPSPLMGMRYELFVGCSLAFSHCYATVFLARPRHPRAP